jgi:hypothetical protein
VTNEIDKDTTPRQHGSTHSDASRLTPWAAIRRCSRWALPVGICFSVLAIFAVMKSIVPRYRAVCLLEANVDYLQFGDADPVGQDLASTEKLHFIHPVVLNAVLEDESLRVAPSLSDPGSAAERLRENLSVESGGSTSRMAVSYEDADRIAAAMVCNAVVSCYLRKLDGFDANSISTLESLESEIERWERDVEHRKDVLVKLRERVAAIRTEHSLGDRVRVLAPAMPPNDRVEPLPIKRLASVSIASFLLPFLIGCLWQFGGRDRGDSSAAEDVEQ